MPTYTFPQDLRDSQLALHQTHAAYEQYARTLPWSADPMPGWEGDKQLHSGYRSAKPDSPGYTDEQRQEVARLRAELLEMSIQVAMHPFWATLERGDVVEGRIALQHTREPPAMPEAAAAEAAAAEAAAAEAA
ncbi:hypothetical protein ABZY45_13725 [Streptomyces sp. NPDC006516]|uniref:hypothetical protein n=1 Tax=Streptomyces sp. NPDC006516 TaxID=3154309 RepID=UPI0033AF8EC7